MINLFATLTILIIFARYLFSEYAYIVCFGFLVFYSAILILYNKHQNFRAGTAIIFFLILGSLSVGIAHFAVLDHFLAFLIFILPLLGWLLVFQTNQIDKDKIIFAYKLGVIMVAVSAIIQTFLIPDLFGFSKHPIYNESLHGTFGFRATGIFGSPQNLSFILGIGLFFNYTKSILYNLFIKLSIIIAGISTLSSFFGGALAIYLLSKLKWFSLLFIVPAFFYLIQIDTANTNFEALSLAEVLTLGNRFNFQPFESLTLTQALFGNGPGSGTQTFIERGLFFNNYQSESFFLSILFEYGILFFVATVLFVFLYSFYLFYLFIRKEIPLENLIIFFLIIFNALITPSLTSIRMMILVIPIFILLDKKTLYKI